MGLNRELSRREVDLVLSFLPLNSRGICTAKGGEVSCNSGGQSLQTTTEQRTQGY